MIGDSLPIAKKMLEFFYMSYHNEVIKAELQDEPLPMTLPTILSLHLYARIFTLADKYNATQLSALAHAKYRSRLHNFWDPEEFCSLFLMFTS